MTKVLGGLVGVQEPGRRWRLMERGAYEARAIGETGSLGGRTVRALCEKWAVLDSSSPMAQGTAVTTVFPYTTLDCPDSSSVQKLR